MNFKYAPRLRKHGEIRRWSLHNDDYIPFVLQDVKFDNVDPLRNDLFYLDCSRLPRVVLDQMEAQMTNLWSAIKWANEQAYARFTNCFKTGETVPVYNSKRLVLPADGLHRLRISVQGVHCDLRLGMIYSPIIIMEEVLMSGRVPSINPGGKRMTLPDPADSESEGDEEEEPPMKRQRIVHRNTPEFSDEDGEEVEIGAFQDSLSDTDEEQAEWIAALLHTVELPASPTMSPVQPPVQLPPPPPHPRLADANSEDKWLKATETYRMQYYRCPRHGGYLCPDCTIHVSNWSTFVAEHYGCSAFSHFTKAVICDIST